VKGFEKKPPPLKSQDVILEKLGEAGASLDCTEGSTDYIFQDDDDEKGPRKEKGSGKKKGGTLTRGL